MLPLNQGTRIKTGQDQDRTQESYRWKTQEEGEHRDRLPLLPVDFDQLGDLFEGAWGDKRTLEHMLSK